jgi:hypothetical protein
VAVIGYSREGIIAETNEETKKNRAVVNSGKNPAARDIKIARPQINSCRVHQLLKPTKPAKKLLNAGDRDRIVFQGPRHSDLLAGVRDDLVLVRDLVDLAVFSHQYCR